MFVINPDPYSLPCYRIGPFKTTDLSLNHCMPDDNAIDEYFDERFYGKDIIYTENGRTAINISLSLYNLSKNDVVTILTTTGNFYISGCVTREIEKHCKWSRELLPQTKVIFVNHEFGFPYTDIRKLRAYNLPIIEDCAGSFFSVDQNKDIGEIGDFIIYSFPKMFPLQIGGLLVSNIPGKLDFSYQIGTERVRYIKNVLSYHIKSKDGIIKKRKSNYIFLRSQFNSLGLSERFCVYDGIVPGVFMFKTGDLKLDLTGLKKYCWSHGMQCSIFYGEDAFFIPVHQALNEGDMLYFYEVVKSYISKAEL
jgi:hypothetical protein